MVSDRMFSNTTAEATAAKAVAADAAAEAAAEDWQRHDNDRNAALVDVAAAEAAANDAKLAAFTASEEAVTLGAADQARANIYVIDRSAVDVPASFALDAGRFFVADLTIVYLAHPEGGVLRDAKVGTRR